MSDKPQENGFLIPEIIPGGTETMLHAHVANRLVRRLNALAKMAVQRGTRDEFRLTDGNAILTIARDVASEEGAAGSSVGVYKITSVANLTSNYVAAKTVSFDASNAETLGSSAVNVALAWALRDAQASVRVPEYAVDQYIVVAEVPDGAGVVVSGSQLTLIDLGIGRKDASLGVVMKAEITSATLSSGVPTLVCDIYGSDEVTVELSSVTIALPHELRTRPDSNLEIHPVYNVGDFISVARQIGGTGTTTAATNKWLDLNVDSRKWCLPVSFCISGSSVDFWVACTTN
jgi:hypothetical protein